MGPRLAKMIADEGSARIGQTSILSRCVHLLEPEHPGRVVVLEGADAGKVFYGRSDRGQIFHLDIFHQEGEIDHRAAARAVIKAVDRHFGVSAAGFDLPGHIDLQTGTGGGRADGALNFGKKPSLRRAHRSHIHIAAWLPLAEAGFFLVLVDELEEVIQRYGYELRMIEEIEPRADSGAGVNLSDFTDLSDTALGGDVREEADRQLMRLGIETGGAKTLKSVLDRLEAAAGLSPPDGEALPRVLQALSREGLALPGPSGWNLTLKGKRIRDQLENRLREIESMLIQTLRRRSSGSAEKEARRRPVIEGRRASGGGGVRPKTAVSFGTGFKSAGLAAAETVIRSLLRTGGGCLRIAADDLMVHPRKTVSPLDVCVLIDSSASMAGSRIYAAKYLIRHLLHSTRDRIGVLTFRGGEASLLVPLTRRLSRVEEGLKGLVPSGLTPMAHGLSEGSRYLKRSLARRSLLLLVTDGIPTVPKWTANPVSDAIRAAETVASSRVSFGCIGLEPSRAYLEAITRAGKGSLYILDDLDEGTLVAVARRELTKISRVLR